MKNLRPRRREAIAVLASLSACVRLFRGIRGGKSRASWIVVLPGSASQRDPQTYAIIGAAMEVHRQLGCGFLEAVYQTALGLEFDRRGIERKAEVALPIAYKGQRLPVSYRVDFLCYGDVIVEIKAVVALTAVDLSQVINYLRASQYGRALLLNFGRRSLEYRRVVWTAGRANIEGRLRGDRPRRFE